MHIFFFWILNNMFSSFPIQLFAIFNQRDWKENFKLNIYFSKCTSLIKHRGNLNAQTFKLIFCEFVEFMVLKLLKLKISWILQEHPFFIWLILLMQFLISAIMPTPVWSPVAWTYHSYARLLFHRDTLLTLLGLWLPVSQGGGDLLPCLSLSS